MKRREIHAWVDGSKFCERYMDVAAKAHLHFILSGCCKKGVGAVQSRKVQGECATCKIGQGRSQGGSSFAKL
ncbi:hypothetical protein POVCU1_015740, partial [Plasmodium ovale curtisi]